MKAILCRKSTLAEWFIWRRLGCVVRNLAQAAVRGLLVPVTLVHGCSIQCIDDIVLQEACMPARICWTEADRRQAACGYFLFWPCTADPHISGCEVAANAQVPRAQLRSDSRHIWYRRLTMLSGISTNSRFSSKPEALNHKARKQRHTAYTAYPPDKRTCAKSV